MLRKPAQLRYRQGFAGKVNERDVNSPIAEEPQRLLCGAGFAPAEYLRLKLVVQLEADALRRPRRDLRSGVDIPTSQPLSDLRTTISLPVASAAFIRR